MKAKADNSTRRDTTTKNRRRSSRTHQIAPPYPTKMAKPMKNLPNYRTTPQLLLLVTLGLSGCVLGELRDANTQANITNATVIGVGKCTGSGCLTSSIALADDVSGFYVFDAYHPTDPIRMEPAADRDTIGLFHSKAGYPARYPPR